jgi:hypothetical protein
MDARSDSDIPAFRRDVTILWELHLTELVRIRRREPLESISGSTSKFLAKFSPYQGMFCAIEMVCWLANEPGFVTAYWLDDGRGTRGRSRGTSFFLQLQVQTVFRAPFSFPVGLEGTPSNEASLSPLPSAEITSVCSFNQSLCNSTTGDLPPITSSWRQAPRDSRPVQLNTGGYSPYVTSTLTRGWVCRLQFLLVLASAFILRSNSRGNHGNILLSQIWDSLKLEGQVPVFISPRNRVAWLYPQAPGYVVLLPLFL